MFHMQSYEYVRKVNQDRLERSLRRFAIRHTTDEPSVSSQPEAVVVEVVFPSGCPYDELTA
ncbi:MAG: hypothetical protein DWQ20_04785 [Actinobacteria bacterium]|nr:MAG: hypothetical protein DWQ20_04785 [Actinomycetota bacterium]